VTSAQGTSNQIVRTLEPLNSEPHLDELVRDIVTPADAFYVRTHGTVPSIDESRFVLTVDGDVRAPLRLAMRDVRARFEKATVMATLQCAGNRRAEMAAIAPIPGEVEWGSQAIGNAVWAGARLADVLQEAGLGPDARHVAFLGADAIEKHGGRIAFGASVSIAKALERDTLLAYEMNGLPLEPLHGYPLRTIVPGYIGARSVKWLSSITVQAHESDNFYQAHSYKIFPPDVHAESAVWESVPAIEDVAINAVICRPGDRAVLEPGSIAVCGYAIGAGGAPIERVEVSGDGGATWTQADLLGRDEPWRWNVWEARIGVESGTHTIVARARDSLGNEQPSEGAGSWNFKGYHWNAWHRVTVSVS